MKLVQKSEGNKIFQRKDGRYAVKSSKGSSVNGEEKIAILAAAGLVSKPEPKPEPVEEVAAEEASSEDSAENTDAETVSEEAAE